MHHVVELTVLYVCVGNSCRSPMAEAMTRTLGGGRVVARSAGLQPLGWIAEPTRAILQQLGYESSGLRSKGLDEVELEDVDVVVLLLASRPHGKVIGSLGIPEIWWQLRDPFGEEDQVYLDVAKALEKRVRSFIEREVGGELPVA